MIATQNKTQSTATTVNFPWRDFLIIIAIALVGRLLLLASNSVSFHSDEAVVALMARHITQGARPIFFYGQAYMGSLDAWLVAVGFQLFGQSVASIRIVQSVLFLLVVATGYLVAWQLSYQRIVAAVTGLTFALASVVVATYTTATLGGYNEVLLLGNIILIAGHRVISRTARQWRWWGLLGLCAGLGWWANGLIVMFLLPVGLLGLVELFTRLRTRDHLNSYVVGITIAALCFLIGSAPWWIYDFTHDHAALNFYLTGAITGQPDQDAVTSTPGDHALGMVLFGIPTIVGARFPWLSSYFLLPVGLLVLALYLLALYRLVRHDPFRPGGRALVLTMMLVFGLIFIFSPFGADPTGRYFLPLVLPLSIVLGTLVDATAHSGTKENALLRYAAAAGIVVLVLGYQVAGQITAITSSYGLTTQFDPISHIPNDNDADLIAFLKANQLYHGHTNYWVAFRLAFLSDETLQYSASLPYKSNLTYNAADNRYPPYAEATESADRLAYITALSPALDDQLVAIFDAQHITYSRQDIGDYHVYYDFSPTLPQVKIEAQIEPEL